MTISEITALQLALSQAQLPDWGTPDWHGHAVHFYEHDDSLLEGLERFITSALKAGDAAVVIASEVHRGGLAERLERRNLDLAALQSEGRYVALDACETLAKFTVQGKLDEARFKEIIGEAISSARVAARNGRVAAFGEMVTLLYEDGNSRDAMRLEEFWNRLAGTHFFCLHCAYPSRVFRRDGDAEAFLKICTSHTSGAATLELDLETDTCVLSREAAALLGMNGTFASHQEIVNCMYYSGDREVFERSLRVAASRGNKDFRTEFRVASDSGETRWIEAQGRVFYNQGRPLVLALLADTTSAKLAARRKDEDVDGGYSSRRRSAHSGTFQ